MKIKIFKRSLYRRE